MKLIFIMLLIFVGCINSYDYPTQQLEQKLICYSKQKSSSCICCIKMDGYDNCILFHPSIFSISCKDAKTFNLKILEITN